MNDDCGVIRSRLSLADDHSGVNPRSSGITRFVLASKIVNIIVSHALPRTFWRVRIEDAAKVDAALGLFSGAYTGCGRGGRVRGVEREPLQ
jgi:hypothetical protein